MVTKSATPPSNEASTARPTPIHTARAFSICPNCRSAASSILTIKLASNPSRRNNTNVANILDLLSTQDAQSESPPDSSANSYLFTQILAPPNITSQGHFVNF